MVRLALHLRSDTEFLNEAGVLEGHKLIEPIIFGYPAKGEHKGLLRSSDVIFIMDELRGKTKNDFSC